MLPLVSEISLLLVSQIVGTVAATTGSVANGPARVSCDAAYNTPCSRINSRWLSTTVAEELLALDAVGYNPDQYLQNITRGEHNYETGFYPFVFDKDTSVCVAHGAVPGFVNRSLSAIFDELGIGLSSASALHDRFVNAADHGGGWVRYLWSDGGTINSKTAFVMNLTDKFYLGVGYEDNELPPDVPCSSSHDLWCSIRNVLSLVGSAQSVLNKAESLESFEDAAFRLSFDEEEYQIPGGFYTFMYSYDGTLKSHGILHRMFGASLSDVIIEMDQDTNSSRLHRKFIRAAEGDKNGWVKYPWRNSPDEPEYTKIAYIVKINFGGQQYYMGSGFSFVLGSLMKGPLGIPCSQAYNLPCSFDIASKLSSHALSHAISSEKSADDIFEDISAGISTGFGVGDFYVFVYNFNNTCVAHQNRSFIGKSLSEVFDMVDIDLDADLLHAKFVEAAEAGGGFVQYDWMLPGIEGSHFEKISYLFHFNLGGSDFYGGIGFAHRPAPKSTYLERGRTLGESRIPCSRRFGSKCSETNSQLILGRALADLIVATEARVTRSNRRHRTLDQVLADITSKSDLYRVNDFFVAVFAVHESLCFHGETYPDRSGCCVAHGANASFVGKTWQDILDLERITSIRGSNLHAELVTRADAGGGWINYTWSENTGIALRKRAWASRFRVNSTKYYVVVDYFTTDVPATCDSCPSNMECVTAEQAFCSHKAWQDPLKIVFIVLFGVVTPCVALLFWYFYRKSKNKSKKLLKESDVQNKSLRERNEKLMEQMNDQMKGIVKVTQNMPSAESEAFVNLPPVPEDINIGKNGETLLPAAVDQLVQVSQYHPEKQWLYGHVLLDPLLNDVRKQRGVVTESGGLKTLLSDALHDRAMSGWFPETITVPANAKDLAELVDILGSGIGMDALKPPMTWEKSGNGTPEYADGRIPVSVNSAEYISVSNRFSDTLGSQEGKYIVVKVERIQNLALWQSFAVKRQGMINYYSKHAPYHGIDENGMPVIEKCLFHGTSFENAFKIERQGFDRAFAGCNAGVKLGKGVYFAANSEYSCGGLFSTPSEDSMQQMFLSRVAVGDWCRGREGQLTPDPKPCNRLELFDSTVDTVVRPTLFCVFNDAQAYPEYLISFEAKISDT